MTDLAEVGRYYSEKLGAHGASAQGVDWNSAESHRLRLEQMVRVLGPEPEFSLNDLGCGYGALYDHLRSLGRRCDYLGVDVSAIEAWLQGLAQPPDDVFLRCADLLHLRRNGS